MGRQTKAEKEAAAKEAEAKEAEAQEAEAQETPADENVGGIAPPTDHVDADKVEANEPPDDHVGQVSTNDEDNDLANPYTHDAAEQAAVERAKAQKI